MPPLTSGVAVVDKPRGVTSHAVVAQARRLFGRKDLGHAGTLDPLATGVLLVLVGQACKLSGYLTADSKRYAAEVYFGRATDTLDADGQTIAEAPLAAEQLSTAAVAMALEQEQARSEQIPPAVSAIKVAGVRAYALARKGETPELQPRAVKILELRLLELAPPILRCELHVSKGYYVRAFARDLGERLGAPAHLSGLRRLASGPFSIEQASAWPAQTPPALLSLTDAATAVLPACRIATAEAVTRARQGKVLLPADFSQLQAVDGPGAWLSPEGELVAIGSTQGELRVARGFNSER
ncbi:MAG TPA: tRNA pseudouridine(55) synthase TruB [Polyangiaceae bacterium]|nr:tRNA pseudouridine(55) synthase TruB [Polyangiaceae bacterium]